MVEFVAGIDLLQCLCFVINGHLNHFERGMSASNLAPAAFKKLGQMRQHSALAQATKRVRLVESGDPVGYNVVTKFSVALAVLVDAPYAGQNCVGDFFRAYQKTSVCHFGSSVRATKAVAPAAPVHSGIRISLLSIQAALAMLQT